MLDEQSRLLTLAAGAGPQLWWTLCEGQRYLVLRPYAILPLMCLSGVSFHNVWSLVAVGFDIDVIARVEPWFN